MNDRPPRMPPERDRVPDELLTEIGALTLTAARVDDIGRYLLRALTGLSAYLGAYLIGRQGWAWVLESIRELAAHHEDIDDELQADLLAWVSRCDAARRERNGLVHATITETRRVDETGQGGETVAHLTTVRAKGGRLDVTMRAVDPEAVRALVTDLEQRCNEGADLLRRLVLATLRASE